MTAPPWVYFNRPTPTGREFEYIREAIANMHLSGDGPFSRKCQELLERTLEVPQVLLTGSCTHALEMMVPLLDLEPGDEVIIPAFTFVSTANAFASRGIRPVFIDVRPDTLNLDERQLAGCVTDRTRAVVPMHYAGVGCEMDAILEIARHHGIAVLEDNAQGLFARFKGKPLGTFGCLAAQSFHETKNLTCGEGGALLVNDPAYGERAQIIREKGTDRSRFFRGEVDRYTWVDVGSHYLLSDLVAAFLYAQLEAWETIREKRREIWRVYAEGLRDWAEAQGVQLPHVPSSCEQSYHLFYLLLPTAAARTAFIHHLAEHRIRSVFHYQPLHLSRMGKRFGGAPGQCPVTEDISERLVRLPFHNALDAAALERVVEAARAFRPA